MENAVKDLTKTGIEEEGKPVTRIDYRIIFFAAAAFLVGGAAVFGVTNPKSVSFFALVMIVFFSAYLICKALITWRESKSKELEYARRSLQGCKNAFENLSELYGRDTVPKSIVEQDTIKEMYRQLEGSVCLKCSMHKSCWAIFTGRTERYIKNLIESVEQADEGALKTADKKNGFSCERREAMGIFTINLYRQREIEYKWRQKMVSGKEALSAQFEGISEIFKNALDSIGHTKEMFSDKAVEDVRIGISKYAKDGVVCGDSCIGKQLNEDTYLFVLSDGMGSGKKAARESMLTISTLYEFLKAGFSPEYALRALNSILVMKSEEEIFATVDVALLDLKTGTVNFYKAGSADAYIKREGLVETVKRGGLPMGIVSNTKTKSTIRRLNASDMVILVSDGITEAGKKSERKEKSALSVLPNQKKREERALPNLGKSAKKWFNNKNKQAIQDKLDDYSWVEESLIEIKSTDPQTVADLLLRKAIERYGKSEKDDMSILAFTV